MVNIRVQIFLSLRSTSEAVTEGGFTNGFDRAGGFGDAPGCIRVTGVALWSAFPVVRIARGVTPRDLRS
jgi:hypothetical protein